MASSDFPPKGAIVTFVSARGSLELGVPVPVDSVFDPKAVMAAGTVVNVKPMEPFGPGKIPTAAVTIKGRSGKTVTVDGVACRVEARDTWDEALAACQAFNRPPSARFTAPVRRTR